MPLVIKTSSRRKALKELSSRQRRTIFREIRNNRFRKLGIRLGEPPSRQSNIEIRPDIPEVPVDQLVVTKDSPVDVEPCFSPAESIKTLTSDGISNLSVDENRSGDNFDVSSYPETESSEESELSDSWDTGRQCCFHDELASWCVENGINHRAGDDLLQILRRHRCFSNLPKSMKTLLGTPRTPVELLDVHPGKYLHLGVEPAIVSILDSIPLDSIPSYLEMDFNTDGASLDNSGNNQIWPIQCRIANIANSPLEVIGIYRGMKKPASAMALFKLFIEDVNEIIKVGGVSYQESTYPLVLRAFIADAPARAFILNHMSHNSTNPCSKCKVSGESAGGRMFYPAIDNISRTDQEYITEVDEDHQNPGESPLSHVPIGLVSQVPFDPMHLVYLGVMKRMMSAWVEGKFSNSCKLCVQDIDLISERLEYLQNWYPREFARPPRSLARYTKYKATEFRQFLLYTGPVVLYGILPGPLYEHFLLLSSAIRVLVCVNPSRRQLFYARMSLRLFVEQSGNLYGSSFISYNVHGLLHLVDDVTFLGPADAYSSFPYENAMTYFRKCVRKPHLSLQQIANRRAEHARIIGCHRRVDCNQVSVVFDRHSAGPLPIGIVTDEVVQYRRLKSLNFILSTKKYNCCCMLKDSTICIVRNIIVYTNTYYLVVQKFDNVEPFFNVGIPSSGVGFFKCKELHEEASLVRFVDVISKCYAMPLWVPRRLDGNRREIIAGGIFIVAAMHSVAHS